MEHKEIEPTQRRITERDWKIIQETTPENGIYIEVGTFHGASALAAAHKTSHIITIDIYDWQPKLYKDTRYENKIVEFHGTSIDFANQFKEHSQIDVLFIDGSHEYDYVLKDCKALIPFVKKGGFALFHDCKENLPDGHHNGVAKAVNKYLETISYKRFEIEKGTSSLLKIQKL